MSHQLISLSTTASTVEWIGAVVQFTNGLGQATQTNCATTRPRSGWVLGQEQILQVAIGIFDGAAIGVSFPGS